MLFDHPEYDDHRQVTYFRDAASGLSAINALHRVRGGAGAGGIRFFPYADDAAALTDVLRLSRAMSYKFALADLTWGGGKTVILGDPARDKTRDILLAIGRAVESMGGRYVAAPDVGTNADDMAVIREVTDHVAGLPGADTSVATAQGLFHGIRAMARAVLDRDDLEGVSVGVQGAGGVGSKLCVHLAQAGARVLIADIDDEVSTRVAQATGASSVEADGILEAEVDILSPCAMGAVLDAQTIPRVRARAICGAANNQLATPADGDRLLALGIPWAPDYVVSAGGIIGGSEELGEITGEGCKDRLEGIYDTTLRVLDLSRRGAISTDVAAVRMARKIVDG